MLILVSILTEYGEPAPVRSGMLRHRLQPRVPWTHNTDCGKMGSSHVTHFETTRTRRRSMGIYLRHSLAVRLTPRSFFVSPGYGEQECSCIITGAGRTQCSWRPGNFASLRDQETPRGLSKTHLWSLGGREDKAIPEVLRCRTLSPTVRSASSEWRVTPFFSRNP